MKNVAITYLTKLHNKEFTFLSLLGPTERGKTLLLKEISRFIFENASLFRFPYCNKEKLDKFIIFRTLKELVNEVLGNTKRLQEIKSCGILFIEEMYNFNGAASHPYNNMIVEIAFDILNSRNERAVVMDSNKLAKEIEGIDIRVESRMRRNNGIVVEISDSVPMYLKRKK